MKPLLNAVLATLVLTACQDLAVQDQQAGSLIDLQTNPTPTGIATAAQGLFIGNRVDMPLQVILGGSQGREGWSLDPSDPGWRNVLVLFDNTTFYAGSFFMWRDTYQNIKGASVVMKATAVVTGWTDPQKAAVRGLTQTLQALDFLNVIVTRDSNGAVIDPNDSLGGAPGPIATRAQVYARIVTLLDQGQTDLVAAGTTPFPLTLSPGFAGFTTPANFLRFNRALRARAAVYTRDYPAAITALAASFLSTTSPLTLGTYYYYSTNSGDKLPSPLLFNPTGSILVAHPTLATDAQLQPGGQPDLRLTQKTIVLATPRTFNGLTSNRAFNVYKSAADPITIIRNEDLILLRAEARWFTGDKANALADIDLIRTTSGGLAPTTLTAGSPDNLFVDELLYNRRYSLIWEGGHRWIDMRRFDRLTTLPIDRASTDHVFNRWPLPSDECLNRSPQPTGCANPQPSVK
jgi:hypothetical protein